jgi:hypothetical protein
MAAGKFFCAATVEEGSGRGGGGRGGGVSEEAKEDGDGADAGMAETKSMPATALTNRPMFCSGVPSIYHKHQIRRHRIISGLFITVASYSASTLRER